MKWIPACPVCSQADFVKHASCVDHLVSGEHFDLVRCVHCDFLLTNPRPEDAELARFYESNRYLPHQSNARSLTASLYRIARSYALSWKRKKAERYHKAGRLLDFGCGTGEFLSTMIRHQWNVEGVENSQEARAQAEALSGQPIHATPDTLLGKFDLITLWHVLEHLPEPTQVLTKLKSLMTPGGHLFLALPNHLSFDGKHYGSLWAGYDVPRHLWHFTPASITRLLQNIGLQIVQICPMKLDAYYVSLLSEKYAGRSLPGQYLNALRTASRSNRQAARDGNYSSLLYIAQVTTS